MDPLASEQFTSEVRRFLVSVQQRDWDIFQTFFKPDLPFKAVLPGGKTFDDIPSFFESQRNWFEGESGRFSFVIDRIESSQELGVAIVQVQYQNTGEDGKEFSFNLFITFVFKKVETRWYLIYDQNTVLGL